MPLPGPTLLVRLSTRASVAVPSTETGWRCVHVKGGRHAEPSTRVTLATRSPLEMRSRRRDLGRSARGVQGRTADGNKEQSRRALCVFPFR